MTLTPHVLLEGGLFIGAVGLERTYFLVPDGGNFKNPTDLDGVVTLRYKRSPRKINISMVARKIRAQIESLGVR